MSFQKSVPSTEFELSISVFSSGNSFLATHRVYLFLSPNPPSSLHYEDILGLRVPESIKVAAKLEIALTN